MQEGTAEIQRADAQRAGFAGRLAVARRVAQRLKEPAERIAAHGSSFTVHLHAVDQGIRSIIALAPDQIVQQPGTQSELCAFFATVKALSAAASQGFTQVQGMIDAIAPIETMSRDLRPVLRRLREGLTTMIEARAVTEEWRRLIETSGIECETK